MTTTTDKRTTVIRTEIKVMHYPYLVVAVVISIALQLIDVEFTLADWGMNSSPFFVFFLGLLAWSGFCLIARFAYIMVKTRITLTDDSLIYDYYYIIQQRQHIVIPLRDITYIETYQEGPIATPKGAYELDEYIYVMLKDYTVMELETNKFNLEPVFSSLHHAMLRYTKANPPENAQETTLRLHVTKGIDIKGKFSINGKYVADGINTDDATLPAKTGDVIAYSSKTVGQYIGVLSVQGKQQNETLIIDHSGLRAGTSTEFVEKIIKNRNTYSNGVEFGYMVLGAIFIFGSSILIYAIYTILR